MTWPVALEGVISRDRLVAVARNIARDPDLADDLVQSAITIAICKGVAFDDRDRAMGWLVRTIKNEHMAQRRNARIRRNLEEHFVMHEVAERGLAATSLRSDEISNRELMAAVLSLPATQRDVAVLRLGGVLPKAIALMLGVSHSWVNEVWTQAKMSLEAKLAREPVKPRELGLSAKERRRQVSDLRSAGLRVNDIARMTGLTRTSVKTYLDQASRIRKRGR